MRIYLPQFKIATVLSSLSRTSHFLTRGEFGPGAGPPFLNLSRNSRSGLGGTRPDPHWSARMARRDHIYLGMHLRHSSDWPPARTSILPAHQTPTEEVRQATHCLASNCQIQREGEPVRTRYQERWPHGHKVLPPSREAVTWHQSQMQELRARRSSPSFLEGWGE